MILSSLEASLVRKFIDKSSDQFKLFQNPIKITMEYITSFIGDISLYWDNIQVFVWTMTTKYRFYNKTLPVCSASVVQWLARLIANPLTQFRSRTKAVGSQLTQLFILPNDLIQSREGSVVGETSEWNTCLRF